MMTDILKLLLIGAVAAAPPGPVAVLVLQKTLCHGKKGGMIAGTGSATVDTVYATLSLFAVGIISAFIDEHGAVIMTVGGIFVAVIGLAMALKNMMKSAINYERPPESMASFPVQAAVCAMANPGAFALMLALMALFSISPSESDVPIPLMLVSVWCGEMVWWTIFTNIMDRVKGKVSDTTIPTICSIAGYVVIVLGLILSVRGIMQLVS